LEEKTKMKKNKLLSFGLVLALMLTMSMIVGAQNGPFVALPDPDGDVDAGALASAVGDKNLLTAEYVTGSDTHWGDEGPWNLFDNDVRTKYGAGNDLLPYDAVWKYDDAYVIDRFIFATANDNEGYPRRMGAGWTLSGGNSADGPWTVIYTGAGTEYENVNFAYWYVDVNATEAFQYYRIFAAMGHTDDGAIDEFEPGAIQLSEVAATGNLPVVEEAPVVVADAGLGTGGGEVGIISAPVSPVSPPTADPITLIAVGSLVSMAGAVIIAKKRK
jgi:hypothetical protein